MMPRNHPGCGRTRREFLADTGMGFVLVQHLDPAHASALTQLLARATSMPVHEVSNNMPVQPNHVYVIPSNADSKRSLSRPRSTIRYLFAATISPCAVAPGRWPRPR